MSWTLKLGAITHDLVIGNDHKFTLISGSDQVRQRVKVALMHYEGEYFLNVKNGIPYYTTLLGSKNSSLLSNTLRKKILAVPGVLRILDFSLVIERSTRAYTPTITIVVEKNINEISDYVTINGLYIEA